MRVLCPHCKTKALITSTNELSDTCKDLYCICTNAAALVTNLSGHDKKQLQRDLFG